MTHFARGYFQFLPVFLRASLTGQERPEKEGATDERSVRVVVTVTVEVSEKFAIRRVRCTAPSIERAIELAGGSRAATVKILFPIDPESFFTADGECGVSEEAALFQCEPTVGARQ
jgi:hypothetical protein